VISVAAAAVVALERFFASEAHFPTWLHLSFAKPVNAVVDWVESTLFPVTSGIKDTFTEDLLNPLQTMLTHSPWWLITCVVFCVGLLVGGVRSATIAAAAFSAIVALGLWRHAMETLTTVAVAAVLTVAVGGVLGVIAAHHVRFFVLLRPLLDTAQTMPSFIYLLPAVALFGATRFTAIVASVIYAVPPVVRLVYDGIQAVPVSIVEAATSAGSTPRQVLWKVQLPVARRSLLLAANQAIVMVLAMVVVGGLVGAGALGYDVVAGFAQSEDFGKGLAAGTAIVLLGVALDRLTQSGGRNAELFSSRRRV
jgi:glycine betaine/proline transport system permease protein